MRKIKLFKSTKKKRNTLNTKTNSTILDQKEILLDNVIIKDTNFNYKVSVNSNAIVSIKLTEVVNNLPPSQDAKFIVTHNHTYALTFKPKTLYKLEIIIDFRFGNFPNKLTEIRLEWNAGVFETNYNLHYNASENIIENHSTFFFEFYSILDK